ncbi:tRNA glutamyl-Q(34) synthetase GluQRS [Synechococcus elongatus]|uniref:tRNA glutamyl-Q(34) synthetase GluQRS n=1 Tax=Synechococcus elongatus TaxID=32046 RepID=UPI000F7ECED6|nr:tRNA glutamyl-Q(34) synthetase GluQRS [Synechococcus elongatus]
MAIAPRGRFAPTPSGDLHLGSLVAAVGSYLHVRSQCGTWLLRIDDLDAPRVVPGASDRIQTCLEAFGLHWDEAVYFQQPQQEHYQAALEQLTATGRVYRCQCSRKQLSQSANSVSVDGSLRYPGFCRDRQLSSEIEGSDRLNVQNLPAIALEDAWQGRYQQDLAQAVGDFILRRRDRLFSYHLATVVDDARQGITEVIRGLDLLASTPRQIALQQLLNLPTPHYGHLPLVVWPNGDKLSKQTKAPPLDLRQAPALLSQAIGHLGLALPSDLQGAPVGEQLAWAIAHFPAPRLSKQPDSLS